MDFKFENRYDAAIQLANKLKKYEGSNSIILAIPRGGVPIGYYIAQELKLPLEIILSKKIGYPNNPEFAIGSVTMHDIIVDENYASGFKAYIDEESKKILKVLEAKFKLFMGDRKPASLKGKTVILVDDGIATGNTIMATILSLKKSNPKEIIVAVPVSPIETASKVKQMVDDFICLHIPHDFFGVGQFYDDFSQVSDEKVIELLKNNQKQLVDF